MYSVSWFIFLFGIVSLTVNVENQEEKEEAINLTKFGVLKQKIEGFGISSEFCTPGQYNHLICPKV